MLEIVPRGRHLLPLALDASELAGWHLPLHIAHSRHVLVVKICVNTLTERLRVSQLCLLDSILLEKLEQFGFVAIVSIAVPFGVAG